jgi:hypothetical protein
VREPCDAEIGDLHCLVITRQKQILRFYVAMNYTVRVRMTKTGTDLLDVVQRLCERYSSLSQKPLHIPARHVLENKVMEHRPVQVSRRAMAQTADNIRVTDAVEGDRFVLKVLDQCSFQVFIQIVLEKDVERFYDNRAVSRLGRGYNVTREIDLGVAAAAELLPDIVPFVQPAIVK